MNLSQTPEIDIDTLARAGQGAVLVDVREPGEYAQAHVPHARLVPMGQLPSRLEELDRDSTTYVICASGGRSSAMTDFLRSNGFDAYTVAGGTSAWIGAGHPIEGGTK